MAVDKGGLAAIAVADEDAAKPAGSQRRGQPGRREQPGTAGETAISAEVQAAAVTSAIGGSGSGSEEGQLFSVECSAEIAA